MTAPDNASRTLLGACVKLDAPASNGALSPWNVLAYEVALEGRGDVKLTRQDFEECVANFSRLGGRVPVVLYHADTDPMAHPDARKAHAWITAMRVGSMQRDGKTCATLEARFQWVNAATRASVESGELAYGSVTMVQHGVDEETGDDIGSFLWSFSLTNNPALVDIPRIAASRGLPPSAQQIRAGCDKHEMGEHEQPYEIEDRDDVVAMLRAVLRLPALALEADVVREIDKLASLLGSDEGATGVDVDDIVGAIRDAMRLPALTTAAETLAAVRSALAAPSDDDAAPPSASVALPMTRGLKPASLSLTEKPMTITFITLAARLGIACNDEGAAQQQVLARAEESLPIRRQLGLGADASGKDVEAKISALAADAARVAVLSAENEALKVRETERAQREVDEHVVALCADPVYAKSRDALVAFARADYAAFSKAYPKPANSAAISQLTRRVTASDGGTPAQVVSIGKRHNDAAGDRARELMEKNPNMELGAALSQASRELAQKARS